MFDSLCQFKLELGCKCNYLANTTTKTNPKLSTRIRVIQYTETFHQNISIIMEFFYSGKNDLQSEKSESMSLSVILKFTQFTHTMIRLVVKVLLEEAKMSQQKKKYINEKPPSQLEATVAILDPRLNPTNIWHSASH